MKEVYSAASPGYTHCVIVGKDLTTQVDVDLCPVVEEAFALLGKKWVGLIIHVLGSRGGSQRFSDLLREVRGLSPRLLAQRLKELECAGIVDRAVVPTTPVQVAYSLTSKGRELIPLMKGIAEWAHSWGPEAG